MLSVITFEQTFNHMETTNRAFIRCAKWTLYLTFVVIFMGTFVRTTHSGMGCPDWPRCFGKWIPPMNAGQLPPDYEKYLDRQDIDHTFNAVHTWTEYANRLCGAALGIISIVLLVWSFVRYFRTKRAVFYWALGLLLFFLSEALLGWALVASNLNVWVLTAHMLPALLMAAFAVIIIFLTEGKEKTTDSRLSLFLWLALVSLLVQIFIGTQVRSEVDVISKQFNYEQREIWLQHVDHFLQIHEIFAWIAALCCIAVVGKSFAHHALQRRAVIILILVLAEILLGLIMTQMRMPVFAQPLHLLFSTILVVTVFSQLLRVKRN
jgi:cytochrome c oxidase assembly protein subunit 15